MSVNAVKKLKMSGLKPELVHQESAEKLQRWLYHCALNGWSPTPMNDVRWTHDDNVAVQHLGWMIAKPPHSPYYDLFVIRSPVAASVMMQTIVRMVDVDPLCAKAVAILIGQRMQHPEVKFSYLSKE